MDTLINLPLIKGAEHILRFDEIVLNIGILAGDDTPKTYRFAYTNVNDKAINLARVRTTCGCAIADAHTGEMSPSGTRVVVLTYHPKNHPGTINTNAFICLSSSDKVPVARPTLVGDVLPRADGWGRYPYRMGKLGLKQSRIEFRGANAGKRPSERTLYGNSGNQSLCLSAVAIPESATFHAELGAVSPGSETDVVVAMGVSLIPVEKGRSFTFPIIIEGVEGQPSDQTLNIKVNCIK